MSGVGIFLTFLLIINKKINDMVKKLIENTRNIINIVLISWYEVFVNCEYKGNLL